MDKRYVLLGLGFAVVGLLLGLYMAMTENHVQFVTHTHIMLVGFVVSTLYGILYKLWLPGAAGGMVTAQYYLHLVGSIIMFAGLFGIYGGLASPQVLGPITGIASMLMFAGLVLMKVVFIKGTRS